MNNNTAQNTFPASGDQGFTLTEALAAISIVSILLAALLWVSSASVRSVFLAKGALFFFRDMVTADERIRDLTGKVIIPYWEGKAGYNINAAGRRSREEFSLEVPWYGGRKGNLLCFSVDSSGLLTMKTLGGGEDSLYTAPVSLRVKDLSLLRDSRGNLLGVKVGYDYRGISFHTAAVFGSFPLKKNSIYD